MTWSTFTKMFGNPMKSIIESSKTNSFQTNIDYIKPLSNSNYNSYLEYFMNIEQIKLEMPVWYNQNWHLYEDSSFKTKIDFHGLTKTETLFWLEYFEKNRQMFVKKPFFITGRGNHSAQRLNKDISTIIISKNDSTGILEDFVYKWLVQHRFRFIKKTGSFEIIS